MFTVNFSEFRLTDYFTVESVQRSILPPREVNLLDIPARHGAYFQNSRYGVREISMSIRVIGKTNTDLMSTMRFLAYCLDIERPTELSLSDEPDRVYYAIVSDKTDIEELLTLGRGTLTFLCPDPFAYGTELKTASTTEGYFMFDNQGTTTTFPTFYTTFGGNASFLSLTSPDGVILIGSPGEVDKTKTPAKTTILNDNMRSVSGWTPAGNILDVDRLNVGTLSLKADGESLYASDYGTGPKWHGPGYRKTLSTPVKDFTVKTRVNFKSEDGTSRLDGDQRGRIEIYLFSASGKKIGKLVMRDSHTNYEFNIPEIFIGNETFLESEPTAPGGKKVSQKDYTYFTTTAKSTTVDTIIKKFKISLASFRSLNGLGGSVTAKTTYPKGRKFKVSSKTTTKVVYPEQVGSFNDFFGEFTIQRVGSTWYAEVSRMDSSFKKTRTIKKTFVDKAGKFPKDDVAFIVVSLLQWSTGATPGNMSITDLKVERHNTITSTDTPTIFSAGDELEIDLDSSLVYLNGDLFMNDLDIGSTFFPIYEGQTEVKVNTDDSTAIHTADFTERFL